MRAMRTLRRRVDDSLWAEMVSRFVEMTQVLVGRCFWRSGRHLRRKRGAETPMQGPGTENLNKAAEVRGRCFVM